MPKFIEQFRLSRMRGDTQAIRMPRRAHITGMQIISNEKFVMLYAEVDRDLDTAAFDIDRHERSFVLRTRGETVPDGALVAYDQGIHVYEVR